METSITAHNTYGFSMIHETPIDNEPITVPERLIFDYPFRDFQLSYKPLDTLLKPYVLCATKQFILF